MKRLFLLLEMFVLSNLLYGQYEKPYFLRSWEDSIVEINDGKRYSIHFTIKEYDVGRHFTLEGEAPDHSHPTYCLWTVTIPAQNFETLMKYGAIEFSDIRDNDGSRRGQTADDLLISWYADPSLLGTDEFVLASFKACHLYYRLRLLTDEELSGRSKQEYIELQNYSLFDPANYGGDENQEDAENTGGNSGTFTDSRDGRTYKWVRIGNQVWMAENLRATKYPDGTPIPYITDNSEWGDLADNNTDDAYCYYNNNTNSEYGCLYTYAAAIADNWEHDNKEGQGVCPDGWHLSTVDEWQQLVDYVGGNVFAGKKLKARSGWEDNGNGTDDYGFSALPGGYRNYTDGSFDFSGYYGYWWSASETGGFSAWKRYLYCYYADILRDDANKSNGFCVRCVRDN